jgi:hypothetical protein
MAREVAADAGCGNPPPQNPGDVAGMQPVRRQLAAQVERAEHGPCGPDDLEPALERNDRTDLRLRKSRDVELAAGFAGVVLGRRDPDVDPFLENLKSGTSRATSSERRNAPA